MFGLQFIILYLSFTQISLSEKLFRADPQLISIKTKCLKEYHLPENFIKLIDSVESFNEDFFKNHAVKCFVACLFQSSTPKGASIEGFYKIVNVKNARSIQENWKKCVDDVKSVLEDCEQNYQIVKCLSTLSDESKFKEGENRSNSSGADDVQNATETYKNIEIESKSNGTNEKNNENNVHDDEKHEKESDINMKRDQNSKENKKNNEGEITEEVKNNANKGDDENNPKEKDIISKAEKGEDTKINSDTNLKNDKNVKDDSSKGENINKDNDNQTNDKINRNTGGIVTKEQCRSWFL